MLEGGEKSSSVAQEPRTILSDGVFSAHKGDTWVCVTPCAIRGITALPKFRSSRLNLMIEYNNSDKIIKVNIE